MKEFLSTDEYEGLRNDILKSIDYRSSLDISVQNDFHNLLENDITESKIFDGKVAFHLKERGLDNNNLENILANLEQLKIDNGFLSKQVESLKLENQKLKNEKDEFVKNFNFATTDIKNENSESFEIEELKKQMEDLKVENEKLRSNNSNYQIRIENLENKLSNQGESKDFYSLTIPCNLSELFTDEIKDYLYKILYSKLEEEKENLPINKDDEITRKNDVLENLLDHKKFNWENSETNQKLVRIEKVLKNSRRPSLKDLSHEGFTQIKDTKNHPKVYFYKERYQMTFSLTPSDEKVSNNKMKEIRGRYFLI